VLFLSNQPVWAGFIQILFGAAFFRPLSGLVKVNLATLIQKVLKNTLTHKHYAFTLSLSLPHEAIEFQTSEITGQKRPLLSSVVFLCPSKIINAGLIRIKFFMVDCVGHPLWWLVPVADSLNPIQSATQCFRPKVGGYISNTGETAMRNNTQNLAISSQINILKTYLPKKAVFNLVTTKEILFKNLALPEALALFLSHPQTRIKFSRMEGLK